MISFLASWLFEFPTWDNFTRRLVPYPFVNWPSLTDKIFLTVIWSTFLGLFHNRPGAEDAAPIGAKGARAARGSVHLLARLTPV